MHNCTTILPSVSSNTSEATTPKIVHTSKTVVGSSNIAQDTVQYKTILHNGDSNSTATDTDEAFSIINGIIASIISNETISKKISKVPYPCDICGNVLSSKDVLKRHKRTMHTSAIFT